MANKIQFKRGIKATLPVLSVGEPALCTDTGEVFIGGTSGNIGIAKASDLTGKANKLNGIITTFTTSIASGNYYVQSGDATFPYPYGLLNVMEGNNERTAVYQTTGGDKKTYFNVLTSGQPWTGWKRALDTSDTKVIQYVGDYYDLNNAVESSIVRSASFLNFPVGLVPDGQGICEVYKYNSGWGKQVFITPHADYTVERIRANNAWLPWHVNFNSGNYGNILQTGGSFTLYLSNMNSVIFGSGTITVPHNSNVNFPIGTQITFINWYGELIFIPATEVVIASKDSKRTIDGLNASATLVKIDTGNTWVLIGALK